MSEGLIGVVIVCVTLLFITVIIAVTKYLLSAGPVVVRDVDPAEEARRMRERIEQAPKPTPGVNWVDVAAGLQAEHEAEEARQANPGMRHGHVQTGDDPSLDLAPQPVDPDRPPSVKIYRPKPGSAPVPCACHGEPLRLGQKVLMWPVPDSEEVRVYCQREGGE